MYSRLLLDIQPYPIQEKHPDAEELMRVVAQQESFLFILGLSKDSLDASQMASLQKRTTALLAYSSKIIVYGKTSRTSSTL